MKEMQEARRCKQFFWQKVQDLEISHVSAIYSCVTLDKSHHLSEPHIFSMEAIISSMSRIQRGQLFVILFPFLSSENSDFAWESALEKLHMKKPEYPPGQEVYLCARLSHSDPAPWNGDPGQNNTQTENDQRPGKAKAQPWRDCPSLLLPRPQSSSGFCH